MTQDWEEEYFIDLLPVIGGYALSTGEHSFNTEDISELVAAYDAADIEEVLETASQQEEIHHLAKSGSGQYEWEFLLDAEHLESEEGYGKAEEDGLEREESKAPALDAEVELDNLSDQLYSRVRRNRRNIYRGLEKLKDDGKNYFDSKDLKKHWDERKTEIGVALSALAAAGLIKKYNDNRSPTLYDGDFDLDRVKNFLDSTRAAGSVDRLKNLLEDEETEE